MKQPPAAAVRALLGGTLVWDGGTRIDGGPAPRTLCEFRSPKHAYERVEVRTLTAAKGHERSAVTEAPFKTLVKVQWAIQGWARHALSRKRLMRKGRHGLLGALELKDARTHGVT